MCNVKTFACICSIDFVCLVLNDAPIFVIHVLYYIYFHMQRIIDHFQKIYVCAQFQYLTFIRNFRDNVVCKANTFACIKYAQFLLFR